MFIISGNSGSLAILNVDKWNENREIYIMEVLFLLLIFQVSRVCQGFQQNDQRPSTSPWVLQIQKPAEYLAYLPKIVGNTPGKEAHWGGELGI